jgi:hypothetical protein
MVSQHMGSNSLGKLDSLKQMGPISSRNFLRSLGPICPEEVGRKGLATLLRKRDLTKFPQLPPTSLGEGKVLQDFLSSLVGEICLRTCQSTSLHFFVIHAWKKWEFEENSQTVDFWFRGGDSFSTVQFFSFKWWCKNDN